MHASQAMMNMRDLLDTVRCEAAPFARRVGDSSKDFAKRVGSGTVDLAERIGPKRALIGLAIGAAAIGGTVYLVRYLRARNEEVPLEGDVDYDLDTAAAIDETEGNVKPRRRRGRAKRRAANTHVSH